MKTDILTTATNKINFTKIKYDINGNPRYVCHFLNLLTSEEKGYFDESKDIYIEGAVNASDRYTVAIKRANQIGGRKYNNKKYGGGIVFQSYNTDELQKCINELLASA